MREISVMGCTMGMGSMRVGRMGLTRESSRMGFMRARGCSCGRMGICIKGSIKMG